MRLVGEQDAKVEQVGDGAAVHLASEHLKSYVESAGVMMIPRCNHTDLGDDLSGTVVLREKWPVIGRQEQAAVWLQMWTDLGLAPRTIDAYARGLGEYLLICEREDVDPVTANRAHVAVFVRELTSPPSLQGANVVAIDSGARAGERYDSAAPGAGPAVLRLLMEEGLRESNPAGRGRYTLAAGRAERSVAWCRS